MEDASCFPEQPPFNPDSLYLWICVSVFIFLHNWDFVSLPPLPHPYWTSDLQTPSVGCWSWSWCWCWQEPRCPRHGLRSPAWAQLPTSQLLQVGPHWHHHDQGDSLISQSLKLSHFFHPVVTVSLCVLEYKVKMIKESICHKLGYQSIHISDKTFRDVSRFSLPSLSCLTSV